MAAGSIKIKGHVREHQSTIGNDNPQQAAPRHTISPHDTHPHNPGPNDQRAPALSDPSTPAPAAPAPGAPAPGAPIAADPGHALLSLLEIEREARDAQSLEDLLYVIANQTPKLTAARQAFVFKGHGLKKMHLAAVTGLVNVDRTVPLVHTLERLAARIWKSQPDPAAQVFDTASLHDDFKDLKTNYPFPALCWLPMTSSTGTVLGALILARENNWQEADLVITRRLASAYAHAWSALIARPRSNRSGLLKRPLLIFSLFAAALAMAIPVPMTTLAPMEIIPADPFIVAAPIDGVVKDIKVEPNAQVNAGDLLVTFENTALKNQLELAEREVLVASARLKRATQLAFTDPRGRHDLGIARAELSLKTAERDYAADLADNSRIKAERSGIAIFSDKKEMLGKPLAVGERIMQIANPDNIKISIHVPLGDSLILREGAKVTLYLDSNPLSPLKATIVQADFEAKKTAADALAYKAVATMDDRDIKPPRLGVRGTAQIFGQNVPLGFYLFRKPISALRQWIGL